MAQPSGERDEIRLTFLRRRVSLDFTFLQKGVDVSCTSCLKPPRTAVWKQGSSDSPHSVLLGHGVSGSYGSTFGIGSWEGCGITVWFLVTRGSVQFGVRPAFRVGPGFVFPGHDVAAAADPNDLQGVLAAAVRCSPMADWAKRRSALGHHWHILLNSTRSLYFTVMCGKGITNDSAFIERALRSIREFIEEGQGAAFGRYIAPANATVKFAKALKHSVTGWWWWNKIEPC